MNERIRAIRKALHLKQREFAERIGLKQNAISTMEKAGSSITEQTIKAICAQYCVNEAWLRTGEGPMFLESTRRQQELLAVFDRLDPAFQECCIASAKALLDAQAKLAAPPAPEGPGSRTPETASNQ